MTTSTAREMLPEWSREQQRPQAKIRMTGFAERFIRDHMVTILLIAAMLVEGVIVGATSAHNARVDTEERMRAEYAAQLEAYKAEQARAAQAEHFLSGEASREAALNQAIDAAARLAGAMSNDTQKGGIICNALARVMNPWYPDSIEEVIAQPDQWMFYSPDNTFTVYDREIAEKILRPYYEQGIVPNGLTDKMVYGEWSQSDYVLRDEWQKTSSAHYWRWNG